jgi:hypothetical protein
MAENEIVVFRVDFNKNPLKEDALAIVPVEEALPIAVVHPKEVVSVPPKNTYGQSYYAKARQHTLQVPQERLLLKDAPKGPMVAVPKNTKLLPPRPNERIVDVKTNKLGEVICVKYTNATLHVSLDGIHAAISQVKFIPPREAPKRSKPSSLEREAERPRTTIAMLKDRVESLKQALALVTSTVHTMSRQTEMNMLEISNLKKENERLVREMVRLANKD